MKMHELIQVRSEVISTLQDDKDCRPAINRHIGNALAKTDEIIEDLPFEQIICTLSGAGFADSETECVCVARMVYVTISKKDILPLVTVHSGVELASRCLVSLGLFIKAIEERSKRRGAPTPQFYRGVGIMSCKRCDMGDIAQHFTNWEGYLGEHFAL